MNVLTILTFTVIGLLWLTVAGMYGYDLIEKLRKRRESRRQATEAPLVTQEELDGHLRDRQARRAAFTRRSSPRLVTRIDHEGNC